MRKHIGIIAGELSGDLLGAGLIHALRIYYPDALIEGIGGPKMLAAGFHSLYPLKMLSVMGLAEVIKHYPRLKKCRDNLLDHFLAHPPDVFIGIDAPDFNLGLETVLKSADIPIVHYVSPSVWAWRQYRLRKIAHACDLMLTLFPFEADYYLQHNIPVKFVGHPLADDIPLHINKQIARNHLGLADCVWIALLPGSRENEVKQLGVPFLQTARWLLAQNPNLRFIVPLANTNLKKIFTEQIAETADDLPLTLLDGQSHEAMAAADIVLIASGTATLEAMLLKRPMVVAYRLAPITYWLAKRLIHLSYYSLPNLLAQDKLVPEFLQHEVIPEKLGIAVLNWLENPAQVDVLQNRFTELHHRLRLSANQKAAQAIISILSSD
ncbi:lipid-A-disaccharide synthase [Candidatus Parabeggiatoa sp. HSG14]|uniref:lipid-A-disaccharide synthase n=1 Tax=Candidatus Parabeggiatoa sp. HSG14 TaxID=3055593 RepID=UPI0025A746D3|nr:lipid-A-disaccharide synthase [Thiotrichales bacterium HSG14]